MRRPLCLVVVVVCFCASLFAAPTQVIRSSFPKPPAEAARALKVVNGKPFSSGFVFIDGRYLKTPYTVSRHGNTIRINGIQVSGELIPWERFLKTQPGLKVVRETVGGNEPAPEKASEPVAEEPEAQPEPEPVKTPVAESDDDVSIDDLFDDEPAPKKKVPEKAKPVAKQEVEEQPKLKAEPVVKVTYALEGEFVPNETTKKYVDKMNGIRTRIDKHLREGGYYFFGSRHAVISGDSGAARHMLEKLPETMRDKTSFQAFSSAATLLGFANLPLREIFANRVYYVDLVERRKRIQEDLEMSKFLKNK